MAGSGNGGQVSLGGKPLGAGAPARRVSTGTGRVKWRRRTLVGLGGGRGHPADWGMPASHLSSQSNPKLLTLMRSKLRLGHYSRRTEQAYVGWVIRFVRHHRLQHPAKLVE